jgi:hypothetical protein
MVALAQLSSLTVLNLTGQFCVSPSAFDRFYPIYVITGFPALRSFRLDFGPDPTQVRRGGSLIQRSHILRPAAAHAAQQREHQGPPEERCKWCGEDAPRSRPSGSWEGQLQEYIHCLYPRIKSVVGWGSRPTTPSPPTTLAAQLKRCCGGRVGYNGSSGKPHPQARNSSSRRAL